jgi:hypothetical protein
MTKKTFIKNLKEAPFNDELIENWLDFFKNPETLQEYIEATEALNRAWIAMGILTTPDEFINKTIYSYYEDVPRVLVYPMLLNACDEIREAFILERAMASVVHYKVGEIDVFDLRGA